MKHIKFCSILFSFFFINLQALTNEIKEFQLEGISLYDSALNHFSKNEIENNIKDWYRDKSYTTAAISYHPSFKQYEEIQISFKTGDSSYTIVDVSGLVEKNIKECIVELNNTESSLNRMFVNLKKRKITTYEHAIDKTGESKVTDVWWKFKNGDLILAACYDWSQKGKFKRYKDDFRVTISNKEFDKFLSNNPY